MKKTRLWLLITMIIFTILGTVATTAALSATANLAGPDAVRESGTFTVDFKVSSGDIYGMEAKLTETGPITRKKITLNSELEGWTVENLNGVFMVYSNDLAKSFSGQNKTLFSITYEVADSAKIGDSVSVKFTDTVLANHLTSEETDPFTVSYTKTVQKKVSTNTNLLSLKINGTALAGFDYTKTEYTYSVPFETKSIDVSAVCAGEGATYSVSGNSDLKVGSNNVVVKVTAASGDTKNYTVNVTRGNPPDLARLTGIKAEGYTLSPAFDPEVFEYTVSVPYTKQSMTLTPAGSSNVSYVVEGNSKLSIGENKFTIKVTDIHSNTKNYTVTVVRRQNNNANLLKLSVNDFSLTPAFDYTVTKYSITVNQNTSSVAIDAIAAGDGATVSITGADAIENGSTVVITVTAMDGSTKDYVITVYKKGTNPPDDDPPVPPSDNASKLSSLSVEGFTLTPAFSSSVIAYTLAVPNNITSLSITALGENGSEVIITGADNLKVGQNRVAILVKTDNKTDTEYVITVTREEGKPTPEKAKLNSITVSGGTLSPIFDPNVFSYIVYLPFETTKVTVSAEGNAEATISGIGEYTLTPGSNTITLTVSAPDGNATYTVNAYVMPAFDGTLPNQGSNQSGTNGILSIIGSNTVGGKLTVQCKGINNYTVRWLRGGNTVGGSLDYIVTTADMGKTLTVNVYDTNGNVIATHEVAISAAGATLANESSGFDAVGMIISLVAALATLVIGFIVGRSLRRSH